MKYERIMLNGRHFELNIREAGINPNMVLKGIHDVYGRPSATKVAIFEDWAKWFIDNDGTVTIRSYNTNFFTLHGVVHDYVSDNWYECDITPTHNYCKLIPNM